MSYFYSIFLLKKFLRRINIIRDGIAEKIGVLVRGLTMFVTTLIVAFYFNWRISLVMLPIAPLSCLSMSLMARVSLILCEIKFCVKSNYSIFIEKVD